MAAVFLLRRDMLVTVRIKVLYFGVLKDLFGCARESVELGEGLQVADVIRLLRGRASNREDEIWASLAVAINRDYAGLESVLHEGDEVALLPPVSGGLDSRMLSVHE